MPRELIGDRFLSDGSGRWIDLATGGTAHVIVRSFEAGWPAIEERLREESHASGAVRLVDYGLVNARQWFEARAFSGARIVGGACAGDTCAVDEVISAVETFGPGVRHVPIVSRGSEMTSVVRQMARRLRALGYVTVRSDLELPGPIRSALAHRHVAVHCRADGDRTPVIQWIRELSAVSPRTHLVVEVSRAGAIPIRPRAGPSLTECGGSVGEMATASWKVRVSGAARGVGAFLARSQLERAEAMLAAVEAEAAVRCERLPATIHLAGARLRARQGRDEEAQRFADGLGGRVEERMHGPGSGDSGVAATGS